MEKHSERLTVTYMFPVQLITLDNEHVSFSLEEINSCTYDHSVLCRIVGTLENVFHGKHVEYLVCGDGALAIDSTYNFSTNDLLLHFNDCLCKLLLGGVSVESISARDLTTGFKHANRSIWPVNFGHSYNSNMHACVRMRLATPIETILLDGAASSSHTISELTECHSKGNAILQHLTNMSTYHLISGITELRYSNWSSAVTHLWIVTEQLTDFLWERDFIECSTRDPLIPSRKQTLRQDHRTYSASVKQEFLYQINVIPTNTYTILYTIRKSRNKLIHEGRMATEEDAKSLYAAVNDLLRIATSSTTACILPEVFPYRC